MSAAEPLAASCPSPTSNALAEIRFASVVDPDLTPSEDETPEEKELQLETVQSAIGVSIGQQQTRLTSPKTPAAEKAAALDETDGGVLFENVEQSPQTTPEPSPALPPTTTNTQVRGDDPAAEPQSPSAKGAEAARLPSPWRAGPKTFARADDHRAALRDSFASGSRRRAMSGGSAGDTLKKYIPFNLRSMPKTSGLLNFSLPNFSASSFDNVRGRSPFNAAERRKRLSSFTSSSVRGSLVQHDGSSQSRPAGNRPETSPHANLARQRHSATAPIPQRPFGADSDRSPSPDAPPGSLPKDIQRRPAPKLRRSNSEGSLLLYRSRSIASSLGDDSRFENVQEQVNSRLKAIKDSWQDANFKLPSIPALPNFGFGSRDDIFRIKNGNNMPRGSDHAGPDHRVTFHASNSSSRAASSRPSRLKKSSADFSGQSSSYESTHPFFTKAVQELTGDIVILGGYRGSILRSAEPPHRQLWVPIKVGLNIRKVDLELGLNPEDEETEEKRIIPGGMLTHIGPVDIAKRLLKRLRASENARNGSLRVHDYGYDWRLSPHLLSRRFIKYLESLPCNQPGVPPEKRGATIIAHSLGGLVTRHVINNRPDLVAGVIYAGVPQNCVNILGPLRNGDDVLLSSRVLTAQVNFTIRTSFALLPLDGKCFINKHTKEEYPVDFFDINTWIEHRLSPCIAPAISPPNPNGSNLNLSGLFSAMSQALPSIPGRKGSLSRGSSTFSGFKQQESTSAEFASTGTNGGPVRDVVRNAADKVAEGGAETSGVAPQMSNGQRPPASPEPFSSQPNPATAVTIPYDKAVSYLTRTLAETKKFKEELAHRPEHTAANVYPPVALIYGKSTPTVYGAKVESRDAIKRTDVYDELAFASGDGVVLARAAMVPQGYSVVRGGVVSSDRGHVTLLGDLEAIGRCLHGVIQARRNGVGMGEAGQKGKAISETNP
ncbi:hypothetical protein BS50DRAFT_567107 [Corynespora cassiicola Philippines]|uniref:Alpha/beta-hydrolase n=1 Tax=Corynespora cassiicola Philippines TaxID=1448308 RepID=A0A2T2P9A8_CORCC|nr:hypothetical protein BS50DRAFT_567107 [Corynespora cassiicola Philippines]